MTSKEALECIIWRLTDQEDDLELRETAKVEIEIIKKDLDRLETLELNLDSEKYHLSNENQSLKNRVEDLEICFKVRIKENEKLKKFALYFKRDIQEGLRGDYRRGENIVYDNLLNEFGKSFLNDLLKEVLGDE